MLLARLGVAELYLVDNDIVDNTNLNRQLLFTVKHAQEKWKKVDAAAETLRNIHITNRSNIIPIYMNVLKEWSKLVEILRNCTFVVQGIDQGAAFDLAIRCICQEFRIPIVEAASYSHNAEVEYYPYHRYKEDSKPIKIAPDEKLLKETIYTKGLPYTLQHILPLDGNPSVTGTQASFSACYACNVSTKDIPNSLLRWVTSYNLLTPNSLAMTKGVMYLPSDNKGMFSTGVAGSHALVATLACTQAIYFWIQDINRAGASPLQHIITQYNGNSIPLSIGTPNLYEPTEAREASQICRICNSSTVPLSCTLSGITSLGFHSEPVVLTKVNGDVSLYKGPGGYNPYLQTSALLPSNGRFAFSNIEQELLKPNIDISIANNTNNDNITIHDSVMHSLHYKNNVHVNSVLSMERLSPLPNTTIIQPCIPAPDLEFSSYMTPPLNPSMIEKDYFTLPCLSGGLVKTTEQGTIHGVRSGTRSAILFPDSIDPHYPSLRLKGCGNIVTMDKQYNHYSFPGFPLREIMVGEDESHEIPAAEFIKSIRGNDYPYNHLYEIRGCSFEHTALREMVFTAKIANILSNISRKCGNYPLGITKYHPFEEEKSMETYSIDKYCSLFTTLGDKRLGANILAGLEKLLLYLSPQDASKSYMELMEKYYKESLPSNNRIQNIALGSERTGYCLTKPNFVPVDMVKICMENNPTNVDNHASNPPTIWPTANHIQQLLHSSIIKKLQIHPYWESLWISTVQQLEKLIADNVDQFAKIGGCILGYVYRRLGYEVGLDMTMINQHNISWGTYSDLCPPAEPHCNAHINNFIIIAKHLTTLEILSNITNENNVPISHPNENNVPISHPNVTGSIPTKYSLTQFLAPVDFDMAYMKQEVHHTDVWCPDQNGQPDDKDETLWKEYGDKEPLEMRKSLVGSTVSTGVGKRFTPMQISQSYRTIYSNDSETKSKEYVSYFPDVYNVGEHNARLLFHTLNDTLIAGYDEGCKQIQQCFINGKFSIDKFNNSNLSIFYKLPVDTIQKAELSMQLMLRLACILTDHINS